MPNIKGAAKAMRQSRRRAEFNLKIKNSVKEAIKNVRKLVKDGKKTEAADAIRKAMSALDKAVKKGVMHKNTSSRRKSRMAKAMGK